MRGKPSAHGLLPAALLVACQLALSAPPAMADILPVPFPKSTSLPAINPLPQPTSSIPTGSVPLPVNPTPLVQQASGVVSSVGLTGTPSQPEIGALPDLAPAIATPDPPALEPSTTIGADPSMATAANTTPNAAANASAASDAEQSAVITAGGSTLDGAIVDMGSSAVGSRTRGVAALCPALTFGPVPEGCPPPLGLGMDLGVTGLPLGAAVAGLLLLLAGILVLQLRRRGVLRLG
jgi:hypothetical protein